MNSICIKSNNPKILDDLAVRFSGFNDSNIIFTQKSFKLYDNIIIHYKGQNIDSFYKLISSTLAEFVISFFEPILIRRMIDSNYFYFSDNDKNIIRDEFNLLKEKNIYDVKRSKKLIDSEFYCYLYSNHALVLTGFVNFRLYKYINYLDKILNEAVNQYVLDKEYISYVNLLQQYINSKQSSNEIINLIYINSKGFLLSENGEFIQLDDFNSSYVTDISFSQNDYVLNTLIGILPKQITLHLITPRDQFIKTIEMIFTDKVKICQGCELCQAYRILGFNK